MARMTELVFKGNNRSAVRALNEIADTSDRTNRQVQRHTRETATVYQHLGRTTIALRESMSGLAGVVGLGGLAFGLKDVVQGGLALQGQQSQLQQALKATGQDAGGAGERLKSYAEALSTRGGFTAPENLQALAAFVRETHSAGEAQKDLALATNIARGRHVDLASAQMIVQRAEGGSIGRLQALLGPMVAQKTAVFGLTQARKEQVAQLELESKAYGKLGPQWLRQQEITRGITPQMQALAQLTDKRATAQQVLAAANTVFGNATGAYAGTTQGKISDLQHSLDNLKDTTGEKLLPVVNTLAKDATWVVNAFSKLPRPVEAAIVGFTLLGVLLGPLKNSFELLRGTMGLFKRDVEVAGAAAVTAGGEEATGGGLGAAGAAGAGGIGRAERAAAKEGRLGKFLRVGSKAILPAYLGYEAFKALSPQDKYNPAPVRIPGSHHVYYRASGGVIPGGPAGTDTVPMWGTPGEGVVTAGTGMAAIGGPAGLAAINSGRSPFHFTIQPGVTVLKVDARVLARAVTEYSLQRGAHGSSSLVGGALATH